MTLESASSARLRAVGAASDDSDVMEGPLIRLASFV